MRQTLILKHFLLLTTFVFMTKRQGITYSNLKSNFFLLFVLISNSDSNAEIFFLIEHIP